MNDPHVSAILPKSRHSAPGIRFSIGGYIFQVLNVVFEQFLKPIPMHRHSEGCYEIHYISCGKGSVLLEDVRYPLRAGSLFMTGPGIDHAQRTDLSDPMAEYCIFLYVSRDNERLLEDREIADRFIGTPVWIGQDAEDLLPLMRQLFNELENKRAGFRICAESLIRQCIIRTVRNYECTALSPRTDASAPLLSDSKVLIMDECFLYEYDSITLEQLSRRLSLSVRQTERLIQDRYHQTFRQKKTAARMHAAASLLLSENLSLSAISQHLGYSSPEHFSSSFRKYFRISPGRFRHQNASPEAPARPAGTEGPAKPLL